MEPMKKGHHRLEVMSHYYGKRIQQDMSNFVKWEIFFSGVSSPGRYTKPHFRVKEYIIAIKAEKSGGMAIKQKEEKNERI